LTLSADSRRKKSGVSTEESGESVEALKVEKLTPDSRAVNVRVKVVKKGEPCETISRRDGSLHRVADVLVGDETGSLYLSLWDDNIDKVGDGDVIEIKNSYVSLFRGSMRLNIGRYGSSLRKRLVRLTLKTTFQTSSMRGVDTAVSHRHTEATRDLVEATGVAVEGVDTSFLMDS